MYKRQLTDEEMSQLTDPATFTGMAERQCETFLRDTVKPVLKKYDSSLGIKAEINV